ncbi:hypothetical protein [Desulfobacter latus]|uniref:CopG family transcriptional regulator n=1 Tax=Desulfobacter latus TaxID=2292 RepID=A0A850TBN9_9BACT|nr:hypothetical protein [Desulfobacter latus]NWH06855.1 hypothetical protein [Desulfobacter latus]
MKKKSIETTWSMLSKNGKVSSKQISIRLPLDLEAQIDNFISRYPNVSKNQIICDLVSLVSLGVDQMSASHHG